MFDTGVLVISQEIELTWGEFRSGDWTLLSKDGKHEHLALDKLLHPYRDFEISITFPIVGNLFLDSRCGHHSVSYTPDWYNKDPGTCYEKNPFWYAPDIVKTMLEDRQHEIASHSFFHVSFHQCSPEVAEFELEAYKEAASKFGNTLRFFVFPYNWSGHLNLLRKHGILHIELSQVWHLTQLEAILKGVIDQSI